MNKKKIAYIVGGVIITITLLYFIFSKSKITVPLEVSALSDKDLVTKVKSIITVPTNLSPSQALTTLLAQSENPDNMPFINEALNRGFVQDNHEQGIISDSRYSFTPNGLNLLSA